MEDILNYYQVNDRLATSGQPTETQFHDISSDGYEVVINLAMPDSSNAIKNEGNLVTSEGMIYIHLPVRWDKPEIEDVISFCNIMSVFQSQKVWVHCAKNKRVSCFIYLYQKHKLGMPEDVADYPMREIWKPEGKWKDLIESAESAL